jgi:hypothetical protein
MPSPAIRHILQSIPYGVISINLNTYWPSWGIQVSSVGPQSSGETGMRMQLTPALQSHPGSEEMSLVQLYIPTEVVHDTISELGEMGDFQFKDVSRNLCWNTSSKLLSSVSLSQ